MSSLSHLASLGPVQSREVAIIGFDDMASAHAQNLRDSGVDVRIGYAGSGRARRRIEAEGFYALTPAEATADSELVALVGEEPADELAALFAEEVAPQLAPGSVVVLGAADAVRSGRLVAPAQSDLILVAPIAHGHLVRSEYVDGRGVPCFVAVAQDATGAAWQYAGSYAAALGAGRAGLFATTFQQYADALAFGRVALQTRVAGLMESSHRTLVEAGYPAELAYLVSMHHLKDMLDGVYVGGLGAHGARSADPSPADPGVLASDDLAAALAEVEAGRVVAPAESPGLAMEREGEALRRAMSWLRS